MKEYLLLQHLPGAEEAIAAAMLKGPTGQFMVTSGHMVASGHQDYGVICDAATGNIHMVHEIRSVEDAKDLKLSDVRVVARLPKSKMIHFEYASGRANGTDVGLAIKSRGLTPEEHANVHDAWEKRYKQTPPFPREAQKSQESDRPGKFSEIEAGKRRTGSDLPHH